jgi:flagellar hook protein FlgE
MGIFDALNTAVAGLQSQSYALQNISGNIANASTIGYKGIDTSFEDLVAQSSTPTSQVAGGVQALSQQTLTTAGTVTSSTVATNMAINGDGFFSVQKPTSTVDNQPVFNGVTDYTRAGDFQVNANGNLVNGAGYYLMGVTVDPKTGNPLGSVPQVLQFQNNFVPAQATSALQYAANLPTSPATTASSTAATGTITAAGGLNTGDFSQNPTVFGTPPAPYGNSSVTGTAEAGTTGSISAATLLSSTATGSATGIVVKNQLSPTPAAITGATLLTGAPGSDSLGTTFALGDTITVNNKTITFGTAATATTSGGGTINLATGTVQDVLTAIDLISGTTNASTITGGKITLNDNAGSLVISSTPSSDLAVLGFSATAPITTPNALSNSFIAGNSIVVTPQSGNPPVNGTPQRITFYTGATPTAVPGTTFLDLATANVGDVLSAIDTITGNTTNPSSVSTTGAVTLDTGVVNNFSITSSAGGWAALGLSATESATRTGGGGSGQGVVIGDDTAAFTSESISGGAVTAYNAAGTPVNLQLRWALTSTTGGQNTWNLFYQTDSTATNSQVAWVNVGTNFVFNADGALTSPSGAGITIPDVAVNNQSLGNVTLNLGSGGLTNFSSTTGTATVNTFSQNGYAAGQLQSVAINNNGLVVGTFSNGQNLDLASVTLSHFNGTNYLQALSGEAYAVTEQSGPAIAGASGTISGSSLEGSNTDIADEFTKLIVTQQAYSANTKVITTANDMVQDLLNVLR